MLLSVIVPMYNAERWIKRCVESILGQTYHDLEVIIIDDGSTDNSLNIVKSYYGTDRRVRCVSTKNQGSAAAKNVGLKYISGDIITFVDADDFIEAGMYGSMISVMGACGADIVECACRRINSYGRELDRIGLAGEEIEGNGQCASHFLKQKNTRNYMCNKIYKRELFEGVRFPDLCFSEDYYMNAILHSKINKKVIIPQIYYNYMIHQGQSTDNRCLDARRIDGIRAGNMVADYFCDKKLKAYASLYACQYALFMAGIMHGLDKKAAKEIMKQMRPEISKALSHVPLGMLRNGNEKRVVCQCILLSVINIHFYDFKWLFE